MEESFFQASGCNMSFGAVGRHVEANCILREIEEPNRSTGLRIFYFTAQYFLRSRKESNQGNSAECVVAAVIVALEAYVVVASFVVVVVGSTIRQLRWILVKVCAGAPRLP